MPEKKPPTKAKVKSSKCDDQLVWDHVTKDIQKLKPKSPSSAHHHRGTRGDEEVVVPKAPQRAKADHSVVVRGIIRLENVRPTAKSTEKSSFQVDASLRKRFEKGELSLDGKIDLHGLTLEMAHKTFRHFITAKISSGARFLLVVTGKGAGGEGVIRKNFSLWCEAQDIRQHILQYASARPQHGGTGAFYILLRKKKGD